MRTLTDEDVDAIARRVVELLRVAPTTAADWLKRKDAERYLSVSRSTFDRLRADHPALEPVSKVPLRWSRSQLDNFKLGFVVRSARRAA